MTTDRSITLERSIRTTPAEALRAFTHPTLLRDWFCEAASVQPKHGGHIFLNWAGGYRVTGVYTLIDLPHTVEFTWRGSIDPGETRVRVTAEPQGDGTLVRLVHGGLQDGAEWDALAQNFIAEWTPALENLQSVLETGINLRFARRPRLGIWMGDFSPAIAAQLGVPVPVGVRLEGTAPGTGAAAAGLQKDDVLVSLNGVALEGGDPFGAALRGLKAGDRPEVVFYRGAERRAVALELSRFPVMEVPEDGPALAAAVREQYARVRKEIAELTAGLGEDQANARPAEKEWSVNELVAHFILCERDYQSWVAAMLVDIEVEDSLNYRPNVNERLGALVKRLGSLAALQEELRLAFAETVDLLAALPVEFSARRKHLYRRAAEWALEVVAVHFDQEHVEQFRTTIAAVKGG